MKTTLTCIIFSLISLSANAAVKEIRVTKGQHKLELIDQDDKVVKTYQISLGQNPAGPKRQEGDKKTPEGSYTLDYKNPNSSFHLSLHVSYPNNEDIARAKEAGVNPGGDIMLHGLPNDLKKIKDWLKSIGLDGIPDEVIRENLINYDWTDGCIAVKDADIEEIYAMISVPTPIVIVP